MNAGRCVEPQYKEAWVNHRTAPSGWDMKACGCQYQYPVLLKVV
jgi:hypothetical protein